MNEALILFLSFYIYSFLGWCFESSYVSIRSKKWINRGFMNGPFLPIYGSGAVIILFSTLPFMSSPILVYIMSVISATLLELVTGKIMETLFKVKYWDYSNNFLNYKGYICLMSSIAWGFMGLLMTYVINEPISGLLARFDELYLIIIAIVISAVFIIDFVMSFKAAYNLRELIVNNTKLMAEINEIKMQITQSIEQQKEKFEERRTIFTTELKEKIETALSYTEIDDYIVEKFEEIKDFDIKERLEKFHNKISTLSNRIENIDRKKLSIIKRNPTAKTRLGLIREIKAHNKKKK